MPPAHSNVVWQAIGNSSFIYGTAWKKDATAKLVSQAMSAGFIAIDTAAQPRHYREDLVGAGMRETLVSTNMKREQLYVQTKFTSPAGQDLNNMPYSADDRLETQLHTSVKSSLYNLRPSDDATSVDSSYIDCLLLHSPLQTTRATMEAWKALESYVPHKIRCLGISNVTLPVLEALYNGSTIKPSVVQNRFYPATAYDVPLRRFCREKDIMYESFWTLTGNPGLLQSTPVTMLAQFADVSKAVALYSLVAGLDVVVLNGTTNLERMREDLEGVKKVQQWARKMQDSWNTILGDFKHLVGDTDVE